VRFSVVLHGHEQGQCTEGVAGGTYIVIVLDRCRIQAEFLQALTISSSTE
jgi:hypothetical protein